MLYRRAFRRTDYITYAYYWLNPGEKPVEVLEPVFSVQVRNFPKRKLLLKWGMKAEDYFSYSEEVGCEVWGLLCSIREALYEPVGMWLPDSLRRPNTSKYVQGVEVPFGYSGTVPEGFDLIELPECKMLMFQSAPYEDIYFEEVITMLSKAMEEYSPSEDGYEWADDIAPRFQMDPQGWRGYIEARPVREVSK